MPGSRRSLASRFQKLIGLETKASVAAPDAWLSELFGAPPNNSGIAITPRVAMTCAPVNCAVRTISEALAQLPVHVYLRGPDDAKERAPDHPACTLLHDAANDWTPIPSLTHPLDASVFKHRSRKTPWWLSLNGGEPLPKPARQYRTPAAWRDISDTLHVHYLHLALRTLGPVHSFSLNLRKDIEARALAQPASLDLVAPPDHEAPDGHPRTSCAGLYRRRGRSTKSPAAPTW